MADTLEVILYCSNTNIPLITQLSPCNHPVITRFNKKYGSSFCWVWMLMNI